MSTSNHAMESFESVQELLNAIRIQTSGRAERECQKLQQSQSQSQQHREVVETTADLIVKKPILAEPTTNARQCSKQQTENANQMAKDIGDSKGVAGKRRDEALPPANVNQIPEKSDSEAGMMKAVANRQNPNPTASPQVPVVGVPIETGGPGTTTLSAPGAYAVASDPAAADDQGFGTDAQPQDDIRPIVAEPPSSVPSNQHLVEARPVQEEDMLNSPDLADASLVDQERARQKEANWERQSKCYKILSVIALVLVVVAITVGVVAGPHRRKEDNAETNHHASGSNTQHAGSTTDVPPLNNLELLYEELTPKTRESLKDTNTPQYLAWSWLHNHKNITNLPEWRKRQIFGLVSFFFSMEGPSWKESIRKGWLDDTVNECSWTFMSAAYIGGMAKQYLETSDYDFRPCNDAGEIQTLGFINLQLGSNDDHPGVSPQPSIPPEIALLTSLSALALLFSKIKAPSTDMITTELAQLPNLGILVLDGNDIHGTLPKHIARITSLKHVLFGDNQLSGTIPPQLSGLSQLEYLRLGENSLSGPLPSQLGLMTSMTNLGLLSNGLSGTMPTELALMANMKNLYLGINPLEGTIPSQLGRMTNLTLLSVDTNSLTGTIPSELGLMTQLTSLYLQETNLSGPIPEGLLMANNLTLLDATGSNLLSGTIPNTLCAGDLQFDCTDSLCGCDCPCPTNADVVAGSGSQVLSLRGGH